LFFLVVIFLSPFTGFLSAGIGSMLSDVLSGYAFYAVPTFLIKGLCAMTAGILYRFLTQHTQLKSSLCFALSGIIAEIIMISGYFMTDFLKALLFSGTTAKQMLSLAYTSGLASIVPNLIQASAGIILGVLLLPFLLKVPELSTTETLSSKSVKVSHSTTKGEHLI